MIRVYSVANGSAPGSSLMKFIKSLTVRMKLLQVFVKYLRTRITTGRIFENQNNNVTIFENQNNNVTIIENQNINGYNI